MAGETDRRIREVTLQRDRLETILSGMIEGVIVVDQEGRIVLMNPALRRFLSLSSSPEGKPLIEAVRNPRIQEMVKQAMDQRGEVVTEEVTFPDPHLKFFVPAPSPRIREDPPPT